MKVETSMQEDQQRDPLIHSWGEWTDKRDWSSNSLISNSRVSIYATKPQEPPLIYVWVCGLF